MAELQQRIDQRAREMIDRGDYNHLFGNGKKVMMINKTNNIDIYIEGSLDKIKMILVLDTL